MNLAEEGRLEEAIKLMEVSHKQAPDDREIILSLASLLAENGQGELGIGHCDEYLESHPNDKRAHQIRSTCLQYLGRFDLALCGYKQCLSGHVTRTPNELNSLSYYRALAKTELSKAARDIQKAIEMQENENWGCRYLVPLQVRTAVAAGLISRHIDRHNEALGPLNDKIKQYERKLSIQDSLIKSMVTETLQNQMPVSEAEREPATGQSQSNSGFSFGESTEKAILQARSIKQVEKNCLGVMLATRALIHEDRKCERSADKDRLRVEELGFDFDKLVKELPSDQACLNTFWDACLYLDTRGFISGRREWSGYQVDSDPLSATPSTMDLVASLSTGSTGHTKSMDQNGPKIRPSNYQESLDDLNIAVLAAQYMELALNSSIFNSPEFSARQINKKKKTAKHFTAVLLYHRMEVHLRAGNQRLADEDQRSIERLGFQPDASLF